MGLAQLLAGFRKAKVESPKRAPEALDKRRIHLPAPVASPRSRQATNHGQDRATHVHSRDDVKPCHRQRLPADLDAQGDLGLRGSLQLLDELTEPGLIQEPLNELFLPTSIREPAATKDSGKGASPIQLVQESSGGANLYVEITPGGHEYEVSAILGSVAARGNHVRQPIRKPNPILEEESTAISQDLHEFSNRDFKTECAFIRDIGEGGFGKVELHRHKRSKKLVVLKRTSAYAGYIKGMPSELHILRDIIGNAHDRLPRLYNCSISLSEVQLWMDYCDGGDLLELNDYFRDRRRLVPEGFVWHVLTQLASALAYLHTGLLDRSQPQLRPPPGWQPIVHRDIKPDNVFLKLAPAATTNQYPDIILGDFGLATTTLETGSKGGRFVGTPQWQPPELPIHTTASDVWSVGAIIHCLTLGVLPLKEKPGYYRYADKSWEREGFA
ncbi:MAG: hypothetical protein L6R39_003748, partial [Caloplaca ligustica]